MLYNEIKNNIERHPFIPGVIQFKTKNEVVCAKKEAIVSVSVYKNKKNNGVAEISILGGDKIRYYFDDYSNRAVNDIVSYVFGV